MDALIFAAHIGILMADIVLIAVILRGWKE